jgi:hypothetical protein
MVLLRRPGESAQESVGRQAYVSGPQTERNERDKLPRVDMSKIIRA